jgi:hypothetical protein
MAVQSSWNAFSAFQVFGDHVPMDGFSLVVRVAADPEAIERLVSVRAADQDPLDPELGLMLIRAGLGLIRSSAVSFVYANTSEAVALLRREVVQEVGQSLEIHDHLVSSFAARMALISGEAVPVCGRVYELPDLGVVRKAFRAVVDDHEEHTLLRSATLVGAQLRGRGSPFHVSMVETIEEQTHLLTEHGVQINALPTWWWRGVAARSQNPSDPDQIELWTELPSGDALASAIA